MKMGLDFFTLRREILTANLKPSLVIRSLSATALYFCRWPLLELS